MWVCTALALLPIGLMLVGFVLLWKRAQLHRQGRVAAEDVPARLLTIFGWTSLLLGVFSLVAITTHYACIIACVVAAIVLAGAARRYQDAERQSLLWLLTAAAERGIPLETAAQAFADERDDAVGIRARDLADYLEAGVPLALALRRSRNPVPTAALLAAELGEQTGTLGPALRQAVGEIDELEMTLRSTLEKFIYLAFLIFFALGMLAFLMIKIVPVFRMIFSQFEMELPEATQGLIEFTSLSMNGSVLVLPTVAVLLVLFFVGLLYYVRFSPRDMPIVSVLWRRADCALVMRWLAIGIGQERPIAEVVRLLASYFPRAGVRARLVRAVKRIDAGADWCDSLRRVGLVRRPESVVFKAAERTGNLAWALEEMADSSVRRTAYRLRAWLSVAFPAAVLAVGACVFLIAMGVLMPLFSLIQAMA